MMLVLAALFAKAANNKPAALITPIMGNMPHDGSCAGLGGVLVSGSESTAA
jgi:hypothetical protein